MSVETNPILNLKGIITGVKFVGLKIEVAVRFLNRTSSIILPPLNEKETIIYLTGTSEDDETLKEFMK